MSANPHIPQYASYPSLQGRTVLISGGATGIGACLVQEFAAQGAKVGFIDVAAAEGEALAQSLAGAATPPLFVPADITDIPALRAAIERIRQALGPITVLLNNAANDKRHAMETMTPEQWDAAVGVNLKHQFFAAQAVAPDMQAAGVGSIINFGSVSWKLRQGNMPGYTSSKAGVNGLTRGLARDLGPHGIRVNTLVPGWTMTEKQLRLWVNPETLAEVLRSQCIGQQLQPHHVAKLALFLASDDSAMCTAQEFIVDGGWV
jgi:NAD(P)-dependent dehydrogenase (short-subunit alcohol dehydrogenase family)